MVEEEEEKKEMRLTLRGNRMQTSKMRELTTSNVEK
jgi:hypothetical protein